MSPKVTQLDTDIAERISALRQERKISQPVVARVLGVTYQSYQKIEAGRVSFRAATVAKLAEFFGVPVGQLYGDTGKVMANSAEMSHTIAIMGDLAPDAAKELLAHALKLKSKPLPQ